MKICSLCKHFPRFQFGIILYFNRHQDHNFRFITDETIGNQSEHDLREIHPTMPTVGSGINLFFLLCPTPWANGLCGELVQYTFNGAGKKSRVEAGTRTFDIPHVTQARTTRLLICSSISKVLSLYGRTSHGWTMSVCIV